MINQLSGNKKWLQLNEVEVNSESVEFPTSSEVSETDKTLQLKERSEAWKVWKQSSKHYLKENVAESLLEWFTWEHWSTAKRYSKKGALGLAQELGVEVKEHSP